jgi:hypothetical protein
MRDGREKCRHDHHHHRADCFYITIIVIVIPRGLHQMGFTLECIVAAAAATAAAERDIKKYYRAKEREPAKGSGSKLCVRSDTKNAL